MCVKDFTAVVCLSSFFSLCFHKLSDAGQLAGDLTSETHGGDIVFGDKE